MLGGEPAKHAYLSRHCVLGFGPHAVRRPLFQRHCSSHLVVLANDTGPTADLLKPARHWAVKRIFRPGGLAPEAASGSTTATALSGDGLRCLPGSSGSSANRDMKTGSLEARTRNGRLDKCRSFVRFETLRRRTRIAGERWQPARQFEPGRRASFPILEWIEWKHQRLGFTAPTRRERTGKQATTSEDTTY